MKVMYHIKAALVCSETILQSCEVAACVVSPHGLFLKYITFCSVHHCDAFRDEVNVSL